MKRAPAQRIGAPSIDARSALLSLDADLQASDAVAALLVLDDGRYVMQLRDSIPGIFYPGHWGCFGGALEPPELPTEALRRELREELEFDVRSMQKFTQFDFDFSALGGSKVYRVFYEIRVSPAEFASFVLHEGTQVKAFCAEDLLTRQRVTPYDSFAIWMHTCKAVGRG